MEKTTVLAQTDRLQDGGREDGEERRGGGKGEERGRERRGKGGVIITDEAVAVHVKPQESVSLLAYPHPSLASAFFLLHTGVLVVLSVPTSLTSLTGSSSFVSLWPTGFLRGTWI